MTQFTSPLEAYEAYCRGEATLEEVDEIANRTIIEHLRRSGTPRDQWEMKRPLPGATSGRG